MSRLTRSTTRRFRKRFRKPWAIRPSISRADGPRGPELDLGLGPALARLVEDALHALLLAALGHAAVLGQVDGDALARHDIRVPPHARVADQHHALLDVVVLGTVGRPHAALARDDPDIAGRD